LRDIVVVSPSSTSTSPSWREPQGLCSLLAGGQKGKKLWRRTWLDVLSLDGYIRSDPFRSGGGLRELVAKKTGLAFISFQGVINSLNSNSNPAVRCGVVLLVPAECCNPAAKNGDPCRRLLLHYWLATKFYGAQLCKLPASNILRFPQVPHNWELQLLAPSLRVLEKTLLPKKKLTGGRRHTASR
jgi:hypothetical protein